VTISTGLPDLPVPASQGNHYAEDATASGQQKLHSQPDETASIFTGVLSRIHQNQPLRDADVVIVLRDASCLDMHPPEILEAVRTVLE
jgi:hypothetical protein